MDELSRPPSAQVVQCSECTIFIGPGYQETRPIPTPEGHGVLCWRCFESYCRQAERKASQGRAGT